jgi:hypothetical protein
MFSQCQTTKTDLLAACCACAGLLACCVTQIAACWPLLLCLIACLIASLADCFGCLPKCPASQRTAACCPAACSFLAPVARPLAARVRARCKPATACLPACRSCLLLGRALLLLGWRLRCLGARLAACLPATKQHQPPETAAAPPPVTVRPQAFQTLNQISWAGLLHNYSAQE